MRTGHSGSVPAPIALQSGHKTSRGRILPAKSCRAKLIWKIGRFRHDRLLLTIRPLTVADTLQQNRGDGSEKWSDSKRRWRNQSNHQGAPRAYRATSSNGGSANDDPAGGRFVVVGSSEVQLPLGRALSSNIDSVACAMIGTTNSHYRIVAKLGGGGTWSTRNAMPYAKPAGDDQVVPVSRR